MHQETWCKKIYSGGKESRQEGGGGNSKGGEEVWEEGKKEGGEMWFISHELLHGWIHTPLFIVSSWNTFKARTLNMSNIQSENNPSWHCSANVCPKWNSESESYICGWVGERKQSPTTCVRKKLKLKLKQAGVMMFFKSRKTDPG